MGSPRSVCGLPENHEKSHNSEPNTRPVSIDSGKQEEMNRPKKQNSPTLTFQPLSRLKRRKLTTADTELHTRPTQNQDENLETDTMQSNLNIQDTEAQQDTVAAVATQPCSDTAALAELQTHKPSSDTNVPDPALCRARSPGVIDSLDTADGLRISSSLQTGHPNRSLHASESTPGPGDTVDTAIIMRRSKRSIAAPALRTTSKDAGEATSRTKRTLSKKVPPKSTYGLQFSISKRPLAKAYLVKHRQESEADTGKEWSNLHKQTYFHVAVTQQARVRYKLGDIVNVSFPRGKGGCAKIMEICMADTILIVIQWLYSRSDAVESGGMVPRLEQWPHGLHMLSDHFQIVCLDNVDGKSDATPLDDHYWAAIIRRLQPLKELEAGLEEQSERT